MIIHQHLPGTFCWIELATTDQAAAKQFYSSLFGWTSDDFPMGAEGDYTIFHQKDRDCSAAYTMRKDLQQQGVPPHWSLYIAVENIDDSTKRAGELGAVILAGPFDVMDKGRMSIIRDPAGAHVCLWQEKSRGGLGIANEENAFCWADLNTRDRDPAMKFYSELLGWSFPVHDKDPSGYLHIQNGEHPIGGMPSPSMLPPNITPHWMAYFQVANCQAATAKATGLGAGVIVGPTSIGGSASFSVVHDPQGAVFALFQPV